MAFSKRIETFGKMRYINVIIIIIIIIIILLYPTLGRQFLLYFAILGWRTTLGWQIAVALLFFLP